MSDSKERIAADILIAMIEKEKYEFAEKDSETTEILIKAFSDILDVVISADVKE